MSRLKIDYGIDLGTTNSSIARMENGEIRIIKNPQAHQMDLTPSAIHYTRKKQQFVGLKAYEKLGKERENRENTFTEFKRTMGTDLQYYSPRMGEYYSSEQLSAEILKALKSFVRDEEEISAAVITVPAGFQQYQIAATQKAAEMAGLKYCELLQEPIAASLAYGFDKRNIQGHCLVFDFGGGTFDAALVQMDEGIIKVVDHAGDNRLGGKNMDELIVDNIIVPHLKDNFTISEVLANDTTRERLRSACKLLAEEAKMKLSTEDFAMIEPDEPVCEDDNGAPIDIVIRIERSRFEKIIERLIDRAIRMARDLIIHNRISPADLETVLLVGGATYIPYLRERVKEEISENINVTIDPMTVVARGAAIFASTRSIPIGIHETDTSRVQLIVGYPATTVETQIDLGLRIDRKKEKKPAPSKMLAEITRADKGWASGKTELVNDAAIVRLYLLENRTNEFTIQLYDDVGNKVDCEPNSISVLQGIKIANPTLPHDIGISAVLKGSTEASEFLVAILKKNQPLPATGKKTFVTPKMLRPGNSDDILKILVWEGEEGTKPERNAWVGLVNISGDMLASLLPEGSDVEITVKMDESRRVVVSAYIPFIDETIEDVLQPHRPKNVDPNWVVEAVSNIERRIKSLKEKSFEIEQVAPYDLDENERELDEIEELREKGIQDYDRGLTVKSRLNELLKKLDKVEEGTKWPALEKESDEELRITRDTVERYGTERDSQAFGHIDSKLQRARQSKDTKSIERAISELQGLSWDIWLKLPEFWIAQLKDKGDRFNQIHWTDRAKARKLVSEGNAIITDTGYCDDVRNIVMQLWELMPEKEKEKLRYDIPHLLHY